MLHEELTFVGTCDIAGLVRGKGFPASELETRRKTGIGWTHSNLMQTCFGPIFDTPFGTGGDLMIVPDASAEVRVDFGEGAPGAESSISSSATFATPTAALGNVARASSCAAAIAALKAASGLELTCAFEQEFVYTGIEDRPGHAYSLNAFRRQGPFGESFVAALRAAGVTPDSFLTEYGPRQFEFTVAPQPALEGGRSAVIAREMARAVAFRLGHRAIFSPMPVADGTGNGVHIHFSLHDAAGQPQTYDASGPLGLSEAAPHFCAGVLHHLPAITAITAPSPVSYFRLTPNRWAPTEIDIVKQDRGAALRVCPVFAATSGKEIAQGVQPRVPRLRRLGQSLYGARRADLRRRRRHRAEALAAASWRSRRPLPRSLGGGARQHGEERGGRGLVRAGVPRGLSPPQALGARPCAVARCRKNSAPVTPKSIEPRRRASAPHRS